MNAKKVIAVVALVIMSACLFAGGGSDSGSDGIVEISILTRNTGADPGAPALNKLIADFEAANPTIKINNLAVAEEAAFNDRFRTAVATGDMPNVFYLPGIANLVQYAEAGLIMDISPLFEDEEWYDGFLPGAFDSYDFSGYGVDGIYGIPYAAAPEYIWYNKDMFKAAGIDEFPKTMDEFYVVMDKLKDFGVHPFAPGARDTYRVGHIHNQILYKMLGADIAKDLGARKIKWTDPKVVETLAEVKKLNDSGAFMPNSAGINWDMERTMFFDEESAMVNNGTWFLGDLANIEYDFEVGVAPWPYYADIPEYKDVHVSYPQTYWVKGGMEGAEYDATIKFVKYLTGQYGITEWVRAAMILPARNDIDLDELGVSDVYMQAVNLMGTAKGLSGDSFDYDQIAAMQDVTRNAIVGMLLGDSPEKAAATIQEEVDGN